ncbi:Aspartate--tRNA ligase [Gossypium arboreum]|uniref:Aspartate--tRNA ligase n=1 Tax=Gossypium arboreum TaxID=29729 RepID=A0A0B0NT39_GOSAR|nr:Aspartate--tRNA ligase [Gossypium arboreum]
MIFGEKEISVMEIEFLLKNMEGTKAKFLGEEVFTEKYE